MFAVSRLMGCPAALKRASLFSALSTNRLACHPSPGARFHNDRTAKYVFTNYIPTGRTCKPKHYYVCPDGMSTGTMGKWGDGGALKVATLPTYLMVYLLHQSRRTKK